MRYKNDKLNDFLWRRGTLAEWAESFKMTPFQLSRIRSGRAMPTAYNVESIARYCGLSQGVTILRLKDIALGEWKRLESQVRKAKK